ncbi:MAG TPA: hypothetical protein PL078_03305 [Bacillota bacterium]|mgnify:CR=1 FL=1|nr:hypothetical protein [Peptococcaceae bacterium MAG4]NLW38156.1 hypothetical protein [Peptococcaceae bacterium]HPZ43011.1 hypothetical protein [Bacillota bacterium]HQD75540.1 hypothetical protein [Bacillota bacterium]HUM57845.1 hypothetical protein [Bacillota bacterium]
MKAPFSSSPGQALEKGLIGLIVVIAAVVVLAQLSIYGDYAEQAAAPAASLEASRPVLGDTSGDLQDSVITFRLKNFSSLPLARVLVNGEVRGEFRDRYVTVYVREGDILEVDGTRYKRPLEIEIFDVSGDVLSPAVDTTIRVEGNIYSLGPVHLSERRD